ncbi:ATP-grasp protein-like protein [Natrialba chahannaoensis JCM 10990]|uniref:ATP-grasp protein-like protein n=1 Tax=Natrialba chahannaoensis JCM 10990 TaxID=1227492 RepID=M0APV6_9EURY|nr:ATP-grasp domain-containing protein [Natrialba chahannaoensis]ELY99418.1 ATP-grasp protein-like protein [Natrialba chahannaoensis JCM 10990]
MNGEPWTHSVVVPAITAPSSVACLRTLGRRDIRTIVVSEDETAPALRSKYCDEAVPVPDPHEDLVAYKDALLAVATRSDVQTIIPVRDVDVYVLAKYRSEFADHVATPWPDMDTLASAQDRIRLFDAAEEAGVGVPETGVLRSDSGPDPGPNPASNAAHDANRTWDQEWIVKARYAVLADEYLDDYGPRQYVDPPKTEYLSPGTEPDIDALTQEMGHQPLLQEYVPVTDEYGFFALYDHGEPVATFQHRQIRGYSYAGGASSYRESVRIPALEEAGRDLLEHLDWHGLAMVEFLRDEDGEFKLMEINPRFWSSLPFSVQAGADFPYYYWQLATGDREAIEHSYQADIAGHLLRGELLYLYSILFDDVELAEKPSFTGSLSEILSSIGRETRFDYASLDDPRPFVRDLRNAYQYYKEKESVK